MSRPFGSTNKCTGAVKEVAQAYGPDAIRRLGDLAGLGAPGAIADTHMAQIAAIRELLDRGYGKATQPVSGEGGGAIEMIVRTGVRRHGDPLPGDNDA